MEIGFEESSLLRREGVSFDNLLVGKEFVGGGFGHLVWRDGDFVYKVTRQPFLRRVDSFLGRIVAENLLRSKRLVDKHLRKFVPKTDVFVTKDGILMEKQRWVEGVPLSGVGKLEDENLRAQLEDFLNGCKALREDGFLVDLFGSDSLKLMARMLRRNDNWWEVSQLMVTNDGSRLMLPDFGLISVGGAVRLPLSYINLPLRSLLVAEVRKRSGIEFV